MQKFNITAEKMEKLYLNKPTVKTAVALSFFYYGNFKVNNHVFWLEKAYNLMEKVYSENLASVDLLLCLTFYSIEMDIADKAEQLLKDFSRYRNYYKNNDKIYYGIYLYLRALSDKRLHKERAFRKGLRSLIAFGADECNPIFDMLTAELYLIDNDYENVLYYSEQSYKGGCRSFYLYLIMMEIFNSDFHMEETPLFIPFLKWSQQKGCLKPHYIIEKPELTDKHWAEDFDFFYDMYEEFKIDALLSGLAENMISRKDYSKKAYKIYQGCINSYIYLAGLNEAYIRSCAVNDIINIDGEELKKYFEINHIADDMKAYVFHTVLCNRDLKGYIEEFDLKNYILQYALYAFENKMSGKYCNSLYTYLLQNSQKGNGYIDSIENILLENLFKFKIIFEKEFKASVSVIERELGSVKQYRCLGRTVEIHAISRNFIITPFSKGGKISEADFTVSPEYAMDKKWICTYFLNRGRGDTNILLCLASIYTGESNLNEDAVRILEKVLAIDIADRFKINVYTALGRYYLKNKDYERAYKHYIEIDENLLSGEDLILMLNAFINFDQADKVYMVISRKSHLIPERDLFFALKYLSSNEDYHNKISPYAYNLIINGWYDGALLNIVLRYYNGSLKNWYELSRFLKNMDVDSLKLDEIILESAVWMRIFDAQVQQVFRRVYKKDSENKYMEAFAYYAVYEIIINHVKPEYETVSVLEKCYIKSKDRLTAYALTKIYIKYSITSFYSELILKDTMKYAGEDSFFLPEFKNLQDKSLMIPYIEKNEPFFYQSVHGNKVYLNYRFTANDPYEKKEMKYFRFGMFYLFVPTFYGDETEYYFTEEKGKGSIETIPAKIKNDKVDIDLEKDDVFYILNNALIYGKMYKYKESEKMIARIIGSGHQIKGELL